ncbi:MAG: formate dehydrogenase [Betaproteobacteria bacterium]|nr:MAG: formate dehydrogenase [Betaproteobacteria bacterium]
MNHWLVLAIGSVLTSIAIAKLPVPVLSDEQKAKAEEAKAKAADAAKKSAADEQRYQDRVAERYFKEMKSAGKTVPGSQWVPPLAAPAAAAPAAPAAAPKAPAPAPTPKKA